MTCCHPAGDVDLLAKVILGTKMKILACLGATMGTMGQMGAEVGVIGALVVVKRKAAPLETSWLPYGCGGLCVFAVCSRYHPGDACHPEMWSLSAFPGIIISLYKIEVASELCRPVVQT